MDFRKDYSKDGKEIKRLDSQRTLKLVLRRALIELEYCHEYIGATRRIPRQDTIEAMKEALRDGS